MTSFRISSLECKKGAKQLGAGRPPVTVDDLGPACGRADRGCGAALATGVLAVTVTTGVVISPAAWIGARTPVVVGANGDLAAGIAPHDWDGVAAERVAILGVSCGRRSPAVHRAPPVRPGSS
jgi:hypothetical protein